MSLFVREESDEEELVLELSRHEEDEENVRQREEEALYPLIPDDDDDHMKPNLEDIRPVDIQLSLALPFQQLIVENMLISEDCMLVLGKGLGIEPIIANLLYVLATPTRIDGQEKRSLVIVLNANEQDNNVIKEEIMELSWTSEAEDYQRPFNVVTADTLSIDQRQKLYLEGGIISVTSRILIVDLLSGIIHPNRITGIVILHVENLHDFSNESFITDMYRSMNKWGFIKGFSESPESFVTEFSPLARKLKDLRLKKTLLWPRFHVDVSACLNMQKDNKVMEVKVSLSNSMSQIQYGLFGCLKKCIEELNRKNPTLALESWDVENCLHENFLKSIHAVLTPNWHRISFESKQLVKDISTLRKLLHALISYDAVDFYEIIKIILDANKPSVTRKYSESPWLMAEESQAVISYAKKRVFDGNEYELEELPKWEQLMAILEDISDERGNSVGSLGPTLIMCSDDKTCKQLKQVLSYSDRKVGCRRHMMNKIRAYMHRREDLKKTTKEIQEEYENERINSELQVSRAFAKEEIESKRRRTRGAAAIAAVDRLKRASSSSGEDIEEMMSLENIDQELNMILEGTSDEPSQFERSQYAESSNEEDELMLLEESMKIEESLPSKDSKADQLAHINTEDYQYVEREDQIIVEKFYNKSNDLLLQEIMPQYIIMYEPHLSFIRRVEVYKAVYKELSPKVYFMYYGDSVEEQSHLLAIKKEKDAFTKLIREHSKMAQHFETDEDLSRYKNLAQRKLQLTRTVRNTRIAGGQGAAEVVTRDVVVVDTREFRAPLPGLLYRYGVKVVPCMLTVGDYIVSPEICIERKSISDLIGSFKSGRLIDQCKKMVKYYKYPTLLIEFDDDDSFSLEPFSERRYATKSSTSHPIGSQLMQDEIQLQIASLIMKFPSLKILWSSSPLQTVNIFLDLKAGRQQPDPTLCVAVGVTKKPDSDSKQKNANDQSLKGLLTIPGLSNIDYFNIVKRVKKYSSLQKLSKEQLADLLNDPDLSERIYNFVKENDEH
ncbi:LAFE_0H04566g1_1 [Lachancea fermentati]|uniref:LAFE_0H04566g1_1 n=1 Tax=Lachancea fermentati TaxID=4955 RepID=A0A1G4MJW1_LACFM|nr:LAFE_0H04566g1_1 [Lachancea fermentati]